MRLAIAVRLHTPHVPLQVPVLALSHVPPYWHVTFASPPKVHVALQLSPINFPAQAAGQVPFTRVALGTDEQLVGGSAAAQAAHKW